LKISRIFQIYLALPLVIGGDMPNLFCSPPNTNNRMNEHVFSENQKGHEEESLEIFLGK